MLGPRSDGARRRGRRARGRARACPTGRSTVVCGKGNNGGDGLVVARLLREAGRRGARSCACAARGALRRRARRTSSGCPGEGRCAWTARSVGSRGARRARRRPLTGARVIVDALLGTGFEGEPRGAVAEAIEAINGAGAPVVSVDVPSGVDASSGVVAGAAVHAALTVTFHAAKPGLWISPGKAHAGAVETIEIGIPRGAPRDARVGLIASSVLPSCCRRGRAIDQVRLRARARRGRLARADRRAADGRATRACAPAPAT